MFYITGLYSEQDRGAEDNPTILCHGCNQAGHFKRDCPQYVSVHTGLPCPDVSVDVLNTEFTCIGSSNSR